MYNLNIFCKMLDFCILSLIIIAPMFLSCFYIMHFTCTTEPIVRRARAPWVCRSRPARLFWSIYRFYCLNVMLYGCLNKISIHSFNYAMLVNFFSTLFLFVCSIKFTAGGRTPCRRCILCCRQIEKVCRKSKQAHHSLICIVTKAMIIR